MLPASSQLLSCPSTDNYKAPPEQDSLVLDVDLALPALEQLFDSFSCCLSACYRARMGTENMTNQDNYPKHRPFESGQGLALASGQRSCSGSSSLEVFDLLFTCRCFVVRIHIILQGLRFLIFLALCPLVPISM